MIQMMVIAPKNLRDNKAVNRSGDHSENELRIVRRRPVTADVFRLNNIGHTHQRNTGQPD